MPQGSDIIILKVTVSPTSKQAFINWQAVLKKAISQFPGFISLEILAPYSHESNVWVIAQRFFDVPSAVEWRFSKEHAALLKELLTFIPGSSIDERMSNELPIESGVTEVFVTQVACDQESSYQQWIARIHQMEASFPGFLGVYVQAPSPGMGLNWITFLRFDTPANLDRWLTSKERREILKEATQLITSIESHRVLSPYAGWFSPLTTGVISRVPVWKQTMLVLLVLFPIVMLEMRYLLPELQGVNRSLSTFIGNAISVILISWPMMPIAIYLLGWWLIPSKPCKVFKMIAGVLLNLVLYAVEIIIFW